MTGAEDNTPLISLVVGENEEERGEILCQFLDSVRGLDDNASHETIVAVQKDKQREALFQEKYPWVRLIQTEKMIPGGY